MDDFGDEFKKIINVDKSEIDQDQLVKKLKDQQRVRKIEHDKKKRSNYEFLKNFKLVKEKSHFLQSLHDTNLIKTTVKSQILNPKLDAPQSQELYTLMENTVNEHQGNSTLMIGPKGSGKTTIINQCLEKLESQYPKQFLSIRLNSEIHDDDVSAIKEIATRLNGFFQANNVDLNIESRQLSATFRNILYLLDNESLDISLIFIIENLQLFTSGNKQTLLYNLLELTQSSKILICVIGTSTNFTTRELLEKRVRSRFSQRLIIMNKPGDLDDFIEKILKQLTLNDETIEKLDDKNYGTQWNQQWINLLNTDSNLCKVVVQNYITTKNFKLFYNSLFLPLNEIGPNNPFIDDSRIATYQANQAQNPIQAIITSLSTLEILLVIASARVIEKSNLITINFNLAYDEYVSMIKDFNLNKSLVKSSSVTNHGIITDLKINTKIWPSYVLKNCWISLYRLGLIIDYVPNTVERGVSIGSSNKYYTLEDNKMVQLDITLFELNKLIDDTYKSLTRL